MFWTASEPPGHGVWVVNRLVTAKAQSLGGAHKPAAAPSKCWVFALWPQSPVHVNLASRRSVEPPLPNVEYRHLTPGNCWLYPIIHKDIVGRADADERKVSE